MRGRFTPGFVKGKIRYIFSNSPGKDDVSGVSNDVSGVSKEDDKLR